MKKTWKNKLKMALLLTAVLLLPCVVSTSAPAQTPKDEESLIRDATVVLDEIMQIPARSIPTSLFQKAEGIAIFPSLMKGGFIVGVQGGSGILLIKTQDGRWEYPRFATLAGGSVGFQVGVQSTDIILFFCTHRSVEAVLKGKFTIGADASVAAGPIGRQTSAATDVRLSSEIYSWSRSRGVFLGAALDGMALDIDNAKTTAFYQNGTPQVADVLVGKIIQYASEPKTAGE
ncbi:MAG: lipid-binding SYLF domain-containing protein [Planctomycetia bacterium]|nr:lipid-binding SYLF domain-containing protein [Planctomycetia bacterium]